MIRALVRGNELDCYGWEHEDNLIILKKLQNLCGNIDCFLVHNLDKDETGGVATNQMIFIDKEAYNLEYVCKNPKSMSVDGGHVRWIE